MTPITAMAGKRVALFGLGGSGRSTARALIAGGASVTAFDDNPDTVAKAQAEGIAVADLAQQNWQDVYALVLSPGVPLTHPKPHWTVELARRAGVEVIGDIELFCRERQALAPGAPFVAITGTNGKSTTTALIAHILKHAGRDVAMGGNIGVPVTDLAPPAPDRVHVLECSSYQIDLAPSINPTVGLLLNLTPDHLDRHGAMEDYAVVKKQLVKGADTAVIGTDDVWCRSIANVLEQAGKTTVVRIDADADDERLDFSGAVSLRGRHNRQNAMAAAAACRALGVADDAINAALATFPGLAHRMQIIARHGRVLFVNDSKATNSDAAEKSLSAFHEIFWIAGGLPKDGGITSLTPHFARIAKAYLIGEAAPAFASTLSGSVPFEIAGTLDNAVAHAARDAAQSAAAEPVVLLAPAAASFDQFANFEKRGQAFVDTVSALASVPDVEEIR